MSSRLLENINIGDLPAEVNVTAQVVDETGAGIPDVHVYPESAPTKGIITDAFGHFSLPGIKVKEIVVISYLGRAIKHEAYRVPKVIEFGVDSLEEVVVTAPKPEQKQRSYTWLWWVAGIVGAGILYKTLNNKSKRPGLAGAKSSKAKRSKKKKRKTRTVTL